jgi:thymidylate synthase (FAD)
MRLIKPYFKILTPIDRWEYLKDIERAGRTCYKSEDKITDSSASAFVKMILKSGHESVIEHKGFSVLFVCDRGVSHELVRHRLSSFSQESTRYCSYNKDKFGNECTFIIPEWLDMNEGHWEPTSLGWQNEEVLLINRNEALTFMDALSESEQAYFSLLNQGWKPQQARSVLPNALKTEIVVTANLREWRLIFKQRTSKAAHPQMRELMIPLLQKIKETLPEIFEDI